MKKFLLVFIMALLAACVFINKSMSVMLAHDAVYLYEGENRIKDNSVICRETNTYSKSTRLYVYEKGSKEYTQTSEPRDIVLFKTENENVLDYLQWSNLNNEREDSKTKTYKEYLEEEVSKAAYSIEVTIPSRADHKTYHVPKDGMTGGTIGSDRVFAIDLTAGVIKQIQKEGPDEKG